ncbi:glycosyl hydrolase family 18 protein [Patescibacteria group bacterium]
MKPKRIFIIIPFIIVLFGVFWIILHNINQKYSPDINLGEIEFDLEDIFEVFIDEEIPNPSVIAEEEQSVKETELSGWIAYWDLQNALNTYKSNIDSFQSLSPTWYYVLADGSLALKNTARNSELINLCSTNNTKLIPTISNSSASELSTILNDANLLNNHVNSIVNEVNTYNYDGIDIDYELISGFDKEAFSNFIKILADDLHKNGKVLTIAILWKNDLDVLIENVSESRKAQDWREIGKHVDEFRIMAYNFTSAADLPGPIAPRDWIRSILDYALENIEDDEKIVLGLPFYAYEWTDGSKGAKALVWTDIDNINDNSIILDELNSEYHEKELKYNINGTTKVIWYQDSEATEKRIELARTYGVNKFIFWRLGGEDPETWKLE